MEKKTLGSFLSVLRKAKGMTQKELAELLNFSFHKAIIGFYGALIGILAGGMCQTAFYIYFNSDVDTEGLEGQEFTNYKKYIRDHSLHISYVLGTLLFICLPLLFLGRVSYADYIAMINKQMAPIGFEPVEPPANTVFPIGKIAVGLQPKKWLLYGGIGAIVGAVVSFIINFVIKLQDVKKGRFDVSEHHIQKLKQNLWEILKYFLILITLLGITLGCSNLFYAKMPEILQKGKEFDNFEEFKEYMETIPDDMAPGEIGIRRKFDNYKGIVYGDNGEILCEYRRFNDSVVDIQYGKQNKLPITVYSDNDQTIAKEKTEDLMWIWNALLVIECIVVTVIYMNKVTKKVKTTNSGRL